MGDAEQAGRGRMEKYFFIAATVALTVYAQLMIKWRALSHGTSPIGGKLSYLVSMYSDIGVLSCFAAAAGASLVWSLAIQRTPLTIAYPFMALTFVLVPLASVFFFRESLSSLQLLGLLLIVMGVALSATSS
jgi:drug/metabolite transporter (DMT)-like permease